MKFKKKNELIEVKTHGSLYVDPDSVFACPECGTDSESGMAGDEVEFRLSQKGKWVGDSLFYDVYADVYTCHCGHCGCKWEEKRRIQKKYNWEIIGGILAFVFVILMIILVCVFGGEEPPTPT